MEIAFGFRGIFNGEGVVGKGFGVNFFSFEDLLGFVEEVKDIKGFDEEGGDAELGEFADVGVAEESGDDDEGDVGVTEFDEVDEFEAVDIGHLEVSDDEVEVFAFDEFEGFRGIAAGSDVIIGFIKDAGEDIIKIYIIV